ncbi:MAG: hypothetical protein KatS3mg110_0447 [Pirellulaceae bacterium]|nr:MAG: hypothetical protein KatS3mg110_0447 [Pirellulaceae bacterium]
MRKSYGGTLARPPCDFRYPLNQYRFLYLPTVNGYRLGFLIRGVRVRNSHQK